MRKDAHAEVLEKPPFGGFSFYLDNTFMYENRRWPLPHERIGPFEATDFLADVPLGNADSTEYIQTTYSVYTYTPLNKPLGKIVSLSNKDGVNQDPYGTTGDPFRNVH